MKTISDLTVKMFADGADKTGMVELYRKPYIQGFTTNPTLMRKAGISDYQAFALDILRVIPDRPISFEVFADDIKEMERQARHIAAWGKHVYVKIPVTNTRRESTYELVHRLSSEGIQVNVTALMTTKQVSEACKALHGGTRSYVSIFAGRIADTGCDPVPLMRKAVEIAGTEPNVEIIWASPRELLNIYQADEIGCHVITATSDILKKLSLIGKDLTDYSLETVEMFYQDAKKSGFSLNAVTRSIPAEAEQKSS